MEFIKLFLNPFGIPEAILLEQDVLSQTAMSIELMLLLALRLLGFFGRLRFWGPNFFKFSSCLLSIGVHVFPPNFFLFIKWLRRRTIMSISKRIELYKPWQTFNFNSSIWEKRLNCRSCESRWKIKPKIRKAKQGSISDWKLTNFLNWCHLAPLTNPFSKSECYVAG